MYKKIRLGLVSVHVMERRIQILEKRSQLQRSWDRAIEDGALAWLEAKTTLEQTEERV
jgi:hypothetical protein